MEDFIADEMKVWKGESDGDTIRGKLATGDYIIYYTLVDDRGEVYEDKVLHQPSRQFDCSAYENRQKDHNGYHIQRHRASGYSSCHKGITLKKTLLIFRDGNR